MLEEQLIFEKKRALYKFAGRKKPHEVFHGVTEYAHGEYMDVAVGGYDIYFIKSWSNRERYIPCSEVFFIYKLCPDGSLYEDVAGDVQSKQNLQELIENHDLEWGLSVIENNI